MGGRLKILILLLVVISGVRLTLRFWDWLDQSPVTHARVKAYFEPKERAYLEISPEARIRLLQGVKKVKIGDTVEEVYEKMGKPPALLPPTTQPLAHEKGVPSNMVVGSQMIAYYIKQKKADRFTEDFDEHIYIFLDEDDAVKYIYTLRQDGAKQVERSEEHTSELQ